MIKAKIVADSLSPQGDRLTSVLCTFPRIILAEVNTHRMLSKNTSSSRAIPFNKMVEAIKTNPFIPIAWQKHHSGMQGTDYFKNHEDYDLGITNQWLEARDKAIYQAKLLNSQGVTKQLCNRLLEPFMWTTMLITGSKEGWNNFFELRNPVYEVDANVFGIKQFKSKKDAKNYCDMNGVHYYPSTDEEWLKVNKGQAEIHIMELAEKIYDAMDESTPKQLKAGEWHIPFLDKITNYSNIPENSLPEEIVKNFEENDIKISTAMAARTSYTVVGEEKEVSYEKLIELHDRLIAQNPPHSSPAEHCARAMNFEEYESFVKGNIEWSGGQYDKQLATKGTEGWCRNYKGFISYRHILENGA